MVTCELCGRDFKSLTPTHLRKSHEITMAEYRARFPDAPLRDVSEEQRENYSKASKAVWANPEYKAKHAPRLAAQGKDANAALQEKRQAPEFDVAWRKAHADAMVERRLDPIYCADCGDEISPGHTRCSPCYQAWRLEQALHPCENPDCENPVKGRLKYCSSECMISDPAYVEAKRRAGKVSQEKHPECKENLDPRSFGMLGKYHSKESRLLMSTQKREYWAERSCNTGYYPSFWNELAGIIRERDEHICQICGTPESFASHDVHHIDHDRSNSHPANLICLCRSCHMTAQHDPDIWQPRLWSTIRSKQIPDAYWDLPPVALPLNT